MRLVILGAGAIGGVVGARLARAGRDVILLARGAQFAAIREHGLRLESPDETFVIHPPIADSSDPAASFAWASSDVVLLAVKTQDAAAALRDIAVPPEVPIVCMTNGIEAERIALRHARHVSAACVNMPATYLTPGVVQVWSTPIPGAIDLGRYPDGIGEHDDEVAGELLVAGFASEVRRNIMKWKRGKLLSNLANSIDALCGPAARRSDLGESARREGRACFAAANLSYTTESEYAARGAGLDAKSIAGATRGGGSTWQSLARGATRLETDFLNGEIAMLGRMHGVPTPVNEALQLFAADAGRSGRSPGTMPLDELIARVCGSEPPP